MASHNARDYTLTLRRERSLALSWMWNLTWTDPDDPVCFPFEVYSGFTMTQRGARRRAAREMREHRRPEPEIITLRGDEL